MVVPGNHASRTAIRDWLHARPAEPVGVWQRAQIGRAVRPRRFETQWLRAFPGPLSRLGHQRRKALFARPTLIAALSRHWFPCDFSRRGALYGALFSRTVARLTL